jgi:hypothetical protein
MYRKIYLFLMLSLIWSQLIQAQSPDLNFKKYIFYRNKLVNHFLVVGDCDGCSLPAQGRAYRENDYKIDWADTPTKLGWYLAVLGTEYKIFKDRGKDLTRTKKELYFALNALKRLDQYAEYYWEYYFKNNTSYQKGQSKDLNGFFIRDDVRGFGDPLGGFMAQSYEGKTIQQHLNPSPDVYSNSGLEVDIVLSGHTDGVDKDGVGPREESIDQLAQLFIGLACVSAFVDPTETYNGINLRNEAISHCTRIMNHLIEHNWVIINPVTEKCVKGVKWAEFLQTPQDLIHNALYCNAGGAHAFSLAQALAGAANKITGNNSYGWHLNHSVNYAWQATQSVQKSFGDNNTMINSLAAIGSSWVSLGGIINIPQFLPSSISIPIDANNTGLILLDRTTSTNQEIMLLLHDALHNPAVKYSDYLKGDMKILMDRAPCMGTGGIGNNVNEWRANNRFTRFNPPHAQFYNDEFDGLDYMLLHNLYEIIFGRDTEQVQAEFNITVPITGTFIGTKNNPLTITSYNIFSSAGVTPNGDLTLKANNEVVLTNGFHAEAGSDFLAYTAPLGLCSYLHNPEPLWVAGASQPKDFFDKEFENNEFITPEDSIYAVSDNLEVSTFYEDIKNYNNDIQIFPNPSSGKFLISKNSSLKGCSISVFNSLGYKMLSKTISEDISDVQFDLSESPAGIYFIRLTSGSETIIKKIIIN